MTVQTPQRHAPAYWITRADELLAVADEERLEHDRINATETLLEALTCAVLALVETQNR
jgi:hypothetical protein